MLKIRVVSSVLAIPILFFCLYFPNSLVLPIAVGAVSLIALFELYTTVGLLRSIPLSLVGFFSSLMLSFGFLIKTNYIIPLMFVYVIVLCLVLLVEHKTIQFGDIAMMFFLTLYITFFLSLIIPIKARAFGEYLVMLVFMGAWITDTSAYFGGKAFGRRKLCPDISPKKTVEGSISGIVGCTLVFVLYGVALQWLLGTQLEGRSVNLINLGILGICASVVAQVGDLTASIIKRQFQVKDFGQIMPGHGGVIDRFDSVLLVSPLVYVFLMYFPIIK